MRFAARALLRAPLFTITAVLTLALGIGATSAMFSVVKSILIEPPPYRQPSQLLRVMREMPAPGASPTRRMSVMVSADERRAMVARARTLAEAGSVSPTFVNWRGHEPRLTGAYVSASVFPMLGVQPLRGRFLDAADERPAAKPVIVISEALWTQAFGRAESVLGGEITLEPVLGAPTRTAYTVIGVMPDAFEFPNHHVRFWTGFPIPRAGAPPARGSLIAKLADGVPLDAATRDLIPIVRELQKPPEGTIYEVVRERDELAAPVKDALSVLAAATAVVFLIACANVANLLLVRATERRREMTIRASLGARRTDLIRVTLAESLIIVSAAALGGLLVASAGIRLLQVLASNVYRFDLGAQGSPVSIPRIESIGIDGSVLRFTIALTAITAIGFGYLPAWHNTRRDGVGTRFHKARGAIVIGEIAAAIVLLVSAGLLINSFLNLSRIEPGFDASRVLTFQVSLPRDLYPAERERTSSFIPARRATTVNPVVALRHD